jgi:hypothetical protein
MDWQQVPLLYPFGRNSDTVSVLPHQKLDFKSKRIFKVLKISMLVAVE